MEGNTTTRSDIVPIGSRFSALGSENMNDDQITNVHKEQSAQRRETQGPMANLEPLNHTKHKQPSMTKSQGKLTKTQNKLPNQLLG